MTREEVSAKLRDLMVQQIAMQHHYEGLRKLYDAALLCRNNKLSDQYRQGLHDLLDQQLDAASEVTELTRKLVSFT